MRQDRDLMGDICENFVDPICLPKGFKGIAGFSATS
jgi:hypothetical protein